MLAQQKALAGPQTSPSSGNTFPEQQSFCGGPTGLVKLSLHQKMPGMFFGLNKECRRLTDLAKRIPYQTIREVPFPLKRTMRTHGREIMEERPELGCNFSAGLDWAGLDWTGLDGTILDWT